MRLTKDGDRVHLLTGEAAETLHRGRIIGSKIVRPFMQAATRNKMHKGNANHKGKDKRFECERPKAFV